MLDLPFVHKMCFVCFSGVLKISVYNAMLVENRNYSISLSQMFLIPFLALLFALDFTILIKENDKGLFHSIFIQDFRGKDSSFALLRLMFSVGFSGTDFVQFFSFPILLTFIRYFLYS